MIANLSLKEEEFKQFEELGYAGPFKLFEPQEVESVTRELSKEKARLFLPNRLLSRIPVLKNNFKIARWGKAKWHKGIHVLSPKIYEISRRPEILDRLSSIMGGDIILWGSLMLNIKTSDNPTWHTDAECRYWDLFEGVSVWIALSNVDQSNCMRVITRTHSFSEIPRGMKTDEEVLEAAQKINPQCEYVAVDTKPGEFFIFARRLWHTGKKSEKVRNCLLLQYSRPNTPVRIPTQFSDPIIWDSRPVPCLVVKGKAPNYSRQDTDDRKVILKPPV